MTLTEEDKESYERDLYMKNLPEKDAYFKQIEEAGFIDIQVCLPSYFAVFCNELRITRFYRLNTDESRKIDFLHGRFVLANSILQSERGSFHSVASCAETCQTVPQIVLRYVGMPRPFSLSQPRGVCHLITLTNDC